ncbi:MAG: ABC transporter ATP-binding protein [Gemmatimonadota bacterium]|jgi:ABC-2 type transport system ATP-binding protein
MSAIRTHGLRKRYADVVAVESLDLDVRPGEIYGFLGRNGAGKTTTIRMLLGLVRPSAGEAIVLGTRIAPGADSVFGRIGYLVETATAYPNLTVAENLEMQRRLTGAPQAAIAEAMDRLGLSRQGGRRAGTLSLGNRQRLSLARALLHRPELLVLDEPANGLDPAGIIEIRELLRHLADDAGVTVFMSSHILAEVAHLADRIGILHEGGLIEELDRDALQASSRTVLEIEVDEPERAVSLLRERLGLASIERVNGTLRIPDASDRAPDVARVLVNAGLELRRLDPVREDLEAWFIRRTGGES